MGTILTAAIRAVNQPPVGPLGGNGPEQRLHHQLLRHAGIQGICTMAPQNIAVKLGQPTWL